MKKFALFALLLLVFVAGCSSNDSATSKEASASATTADSTTASTSAPAKSQPSSSAQPVAITSWQTWGQNFRGQIKTCVPSGPDGCLTDNRLTVSDMQRAITDNGLDLTATQGGIVNPLESYASIYDAFVSASCVGTPQSFSPEALTCQVKRQQLRTFATQISTNVDAIAAG